MRIAYLLLAKNTMMFCSRFNSLAISDYIVNRCTE